MDDKVLQQIGDNDGELENQLSDHPEAHKCCNITPHWHRNMNIPVELGPSNNIGTGLTPDGFYYRCILRSEISIKYQSIKKIKDKGNVQSITLSC